MDSRGRSSLVQRRARQFGARGHLVGRGASRRSGVRAIVHEGPLEDEPDYRVVCFAGRGPGEVFVEGRKAVGLTQWRVREGLFVSTVLHAGPTNDVLSTWPLFPTGSAAHSTITCYVPRDSRSRRPGVAAGRGEWTVRVARVRGDLTVHSTTNLCSRSSLGVDACRPLAQFVSSNGMIWWRVVNSGVMCHEVGESGEPTGGRKCSDLWASSSTRWTRRVDSSCPPKFRAEFERGGHLSPNTEGCVALWTPGEFARQSDERLEQRRLGGSSRASADALLVGQLARTSSSTSRVASRCRAPFATTDSWRATY